MLPITGAVLHIRTKLSGSTWSKTKFLTPPYWNKVHLHPPTPPPPKNTFNFTAEKIVSLVTNVVIQITQPQLYTKNLPEKTSTGKIRSVKADRRESKKCLGVNIEGKDMFESIISRPSPLPSALCLQLHDGREKENSSDSFYGLKQGSTIITLIIITLHQFHKKPYSRLPM